MTRNGPNLISSTLPIFGLTCANLPFASRKRYKYLYREAAWRLFTCRKVFHAAEIMAMSDPAVHPIPE